MASAPTMSVYARVEEWAHMASRSADTNPPLAHTGAVAGPYSASPGIADQGCPEQRERGGRSSAVSMEVVSRARALPEGSVATARPVRGQPKSDFHWPDAALARAWAAASASPARSAFSAASAATSPASAATTSSSIRPRRAGGASAQGARRPASARRLWSLRARTAAAGLTAGAAAARDAAAAASAAAMQSPRSRSSVPQHSGRGDAIDCSAARHPGRR
mmetsp:Transcript_20791/g.79728  ORF Transcript_20791/g.79728 Transcript_20791/m.79728 type:complete len:220 (-) Transcript_20791:380-1039(-)